MRATARGTHTWATIKRMEVSTGWMCGGWTFKVLEFNGEEKTTTFYRTNKDRQGLWSGTKQCLGTCQFSLAAEPKKARRQFVRWLKGQQI